MTQFKEQIIEYGSEYDWNSNEKYLKNMDSSNVFRVEGYTYYLRSGREALCIIADQLMKTDKKVLMPALCCSSMVRPFELHNIKVSYYRLNDDYSANIQSIREIADEGDGLLYLNFFGRESVDNENLIELKKMLDLTLIEDQTQNFLSKELISIGDYIVCSVRKWLSLPDGAFLVSKKELQLDHLKIDTEFSSKRKHAMQLKSEYLNDGNPELKVEYLRELSEATNIIEGFENCYSMSEESKHIISSFDFDTIYMKRKENVHVLSKLIKENKIIKNMPFDTQNSTLYYPILVTKQENLQIRLSRRGVYCPVIWPIPQCGVCKMADYTSNHILGVPCDHRYDTEDMRNIAQIINWEASKI